MHALPEGFYARVRASVFAAQEGVLRDGPLPPERWMQQIWRHQRLQRDQLMTLDGRRVRILHPGFWNREPGPDFKDAVVQIGTDRACRGDVELDRVVAGWRHHRHAGNPAYQGVLLHVVWAAPPGDLSPPVLAMEPFVDTPISDLAGWLESEAPSLLPCCLPGRCSSPLRSLPSKQLRELVEQAARVRLQRKAAEFAHRARRAGWDQSLWEGLLTGLGYKHNAWPMRRLAELTGPKAPGAGIFGSDGSSEGCQASTLEWEARLLGLSGLLPMQLPRGDARAEVRRLWDLWWRERDFWGEDVLPPLTWRLGGVRPANHPHRRLILAARWRAGRPLSLPLQQWLAETGSQEVIGARLLQVLTPAPVPDDFWARHATLGARCSPERMPLVGATRVTELALNVVLPWLHARSGSVGGGELLPEIERRYFSWPAAGDNASLRLCRQRLFGGGTVPMPLTGAAQQGLHQILGDFCEQAGPLCDSCRFPSIVHSVIDAGLDPCFEDFQAALQGFKPFIDNKPVTAQPPGQS